MQRESEAMEMLFFSQEGKVCFMPTYIIYINIFNINIEQIHKSILEGKKLVMVTVYSVRGVEKALGR